MNYLGYPYAVVPQYFCVPQQTVYNCGIPNPLPPTNQLVYPQTFFYWVTTPQEFGLPQESYPSAVPMWSVEDTANWIKNLCMQLGWCEATYYANGFQRHAINGRLLQDLTDDNLKEFVVNCDHRAIILWNIRQIFSPPSMILPETRFSTQYQEVNERVGSCRAIEVDMGGRNSEVMNSKSPSLSAQMDVASSVVNSRSLSNMEMSQSETSEDVEELVSTSLRSRSLILKCTKEVQRCHFLRVLLEHGVKVVKITPFSKCEEFEEFAVKFESIMKAQKALVIYKGMGKEEYDLRPNDLRPNWPKRPTATSACEHRVLTRELTVRAERQLTSKIVSSVYKNDIVYVNKIKGRRARLVNKAGTHELGWTSLFTEQGRPLLEQVEDI